MDHEQSHNLTAVTVSGVPVSRLGEFYTLVGVWLGGGMQLGLAQKPAPMLTRPARSRYKPLYEYLHNHRKTSADSELQLSFSDIQEILGANLPPSAYEHRAWWANTKSHSQSQAWQAAGWRVDGLDTDMQLVTFRRIDHG